MYCFITGKVLLSYLLRLCTDKLEIETGKKFIFANFLTSFPGANYNCQDQLESFFDTALEQTRDREFAGQVNVVILGSNDHRIISSMHPSSVNSALAQFQFKLDQFVDKMSTIKQSTLILVTSVLPKQFVDPRVQSVAKQAVR